MIATSVAEEGLGIHQKGYLNLFYFFCFFFVFFFEKEDIQACNTVIRYDALDTSEALIQSRGRARFRHSTFIVMLSGAGRRI